MHVAADLLCTRHRAARLGRCNLVNAVGLPDSWATRIMTCRHKEGANDVSKMQAIKSLSLSQGAKAPVNLGC